jgi:type II secretory pathway pseudopilin PulG
MQRKNYTVKRDFRSGMAMIMAITVIVIMATIMALALALTTQTTKKTADLYLYEQSVLLARSAAEYSLLKIAQDGPCSHFNDLNFVQDGIYDINITNRFIYTNPLPTGCDTTNTYATVKTPEQNGSVLIDVSVSVTDPTVVSQPVRYFKRSIQKL